MKKNGVFLFVISSLILVIFKLKEISDDVISGNSVEANHKIKNISGNKEAL